MRTSSLLLAITLGAVWGCTAAESSGLVSTVQSGDVGEGTAGDQDAADGQGSDAAALDTAAFASKPVVQQLLPATGPTSGASVVSIVGSGFFPGAVVRFGGVQAPTTVVLDNGRITVVTPAGVAGQADVVVENLDLGQGTATRAFNYYAGDQSSGPRLLKATPNAGPTTGGTALVVQGDHFDADAVVYVGWRPLSTAQVTSPNSLALIMPALPAGPVDIAVTNPNGQSDILEAGFTAQQLASEDPPPQLATLVPDSGTIRGGFVVQVRASGLKSGSQLLVGGLLVESWTVIGPELGTFVAPPHDAGVVDVAVTNPDGQSGLKYDGFQYVVDAPVLYHVEPSSGPIEGGTTVTLTGVHFAEGMVVLVGGAPCTDVKIVDVASAAGGDATMATCTVPPGTAAGPVTVALTRTDGLKAELPAGYAYVAPTSPGIEQLLPADGPVEGGVVVLIVGHDLPADGQVHFGTAVAETVTSVGPNGIAVLLPPGLPGPVDVSVTSPTTPTATLPGGFTYVAPMPPTLLAIAPTSGPAEGGIVVAVDGANLRPESQVFFGSDLADIVSFGGEDGLAVTLPPGAKGAVDVVLKTPGFPDATLPLAFTYEEAGPPKLTAVTPESGPTAGGIVVAITGINLRPGSQVYFGTMVAEVVTGGGAEGLAVTLPPGAKGAVDVVVKTPGFPDSKLALAFTYEEPGPPKLTAVTPASGTSDGGVLVVAQGAMLRAESTVWFGGNKAQIVSYAGPGGIAVTSPAGSGSVDVTVKTPGLPDSVLPKAFTYEDVGPPTLTAIEPATGSTAGGDIVVLTGEDFRPTSEAWFGASKGVIVGSGPNSIAVALPKGAAGVVDVSVLTTGFAPSTLSNAFTYTEAGPPAIASVVPAVGPTDGGIVVLVVGQNLREDSYVTFGGTVATTAYLTGPQGIAVVLPPGAPAVVDVVLKTPGLPNVSLTKAFTYAAPAVPVSELIVVSQVQPNVGPTTGGGWALVKGVNLPTSAVVRFGAAASSQVVFVSSSLLSVRVPAAAQAGLVDVSVTRPDTGQIALLSEGYRYYLPSDAPSPLPTLTNVKPALGPTAGGTLALLSGGGILPGALVFVAGRPANLVKVTAEDKTTFVTPPGSAGSADVALTNPDGGFATLTKSFVYLDGLKPSVTLTAVLPGQGSVAGGTQAHASGSGFLPGTLLFVDGEPTSMLIKGPTALQFTTQPHASGLVDIAVTSPDGWTAWLPHAFNFVLEAPYIASITPAFGPLAGGNDVTIEGQGFHPAAEVRFGDLTATVTKATGTLLIVRPPAHLAGTVDVTVTNPDGLSDSRESGYLYTEYVPGAGIALLAISPSVSPTTGGALVSVIGKGFTSGATLLVGNALATNVTVLDASTLTAVVPAGPIGAVDVKVVVPDQGAATMKNAFFYYDPSSNQPLPLVSRVEPAVGPVTGGTIATVSVTPAPANASVYVGGVAAQVLGADGLGHLVVKMPAHEAGTVNVAVMLPDGKAGALAGAFTYYVPTPSQKPVVLTQVTPTSGSTAGGGVVAFSGAGFSGKMQVFLGYAPGTAATILSPTEVHGEAPAHAAGLVDAAVTRNDGYSSVLPAAYAYADPPPKPEALFPTVAAVEGGGVAVVSGTGFLPGALVFIGGTQALILQSFGGTVITFEVPASAQTGAKDVQVLNPDGKSGTLTGALTYTNQPFTSAPPKVLTIVPANGPWQGGTVAAVYGEGFLPNAQVLVGGKPATVHYVDSHVATITTPVGSVGPVDVTLLNPDGQGHSLASGFSYIVTTKAAPALYGITPSSGPEGGGTSVILTGNKLTGGGLGFVAYRPVSSWAVLNSSIAIGTTRPATPGVHDVVATNGDGQSAVLKGAFNYVGAPHIDSFEPDIGAVAGGTLLTFAGSNFDSQAVVRIGGKLAASVTVLSPYVMKVVTPPGGPGPAQVRVTNPDNQYDVAGFDYLYVLPPTISSVFPPQGATGGGTPIILIGKDFLAGMDIAFGTASCADVFVTPDGKAATCFSPPGPAGQIVDVTAENPDGQTGIVYKPFKYVDGASISLPGITSLKPPTGPTSGGTWGLATGSLFQNGARAIFGRTPATDLAVIGGTVARYVSPPVKAPATVSITLVNPDGGWATGPASFAYTDPATLDAPPGVSSLTPMAGPTKGGTPVLFVGSDLSDESVVFFATTAATAITAAGGGFTAVTPAHESGLVEVVVTDVEGQTVHLVDAFEFIPPPVLVSVSPKAGPSGGGTFVDLTGANFVVGSSAASSSHVYVCETQTTNMICTGADEASITVKSATSIRFVTPQFVPVLADIKVVNPDGQQTLLPKAFTFNPPPKVVAVTPPTGTTKGGTLVQVHGEGFQPGLQVTFGTAKGLEVQVLDSTTIQCKTPPGDAGPVIVTVSNPDLSSHAISGGFTFIEPPKIVTIFPTLGPEPGGTDVTIQGKGFVPGQTKVYFGANQVSGAVVVSQALITLKSPPGTGPVAVKVVNPDAQQDLVGGGFVYIPVIPAPVITSISPASGLVNGGYYINVIGNNFLQGAAVWFATEKGYDAKVLNAGTLIVVTVPPGAQGGKVDLKVVNTDGQNDTLEQSFEYIAPLGLPNLTWGGIVPKRGPKAGGYSMTIYGQGFKQGLRVFFGKAATEEWVEADGVQRLGPTLLAFSMPTYPVNGFVDVRVVNPSFGGNLDQVVAPNAFEFGQAVIFEQIGNRLPNDLRRSDRNATIFDANRDGLNDILVFNDGYNLQDDLYFNTVDEDGMAGWFRDQSSLLPTTTYDETFQRVVDIDGDTDLDVMFIRQSYLWTYRNQGDGSFTAVQGVYTGAFNDWAWGDLNCDGIPDFVIVKDGVDSVYIGSSAGTFKLATLPLTTTNVLPTLSEPGRGVAVGDVDGDSDNDIIIANDQAFQTRLYLNNCNNIALPPTCSYDVPGCTIATNNGHRYAVCNQEQPAWQDAQNKCAAMNMHLATVDSAEENTFIRSQIGGQAWIGYNDATLEGTFSWIFGAPSYTNWCASEPASNNTSRNQAVMQGTGAGCWQLKYYYEGNRYVCEAENAVKCPDTWHFTDVEYGNLKVFPVAGFNGRDILLGDIDGDGDRDVLLFSYPQRTHVYINEFGKFKEALFNWPETAPPNQDRYEFVDLEGDGDMDVVARRYMSGSNVWPAVYINDLAGGGFGVFTDQTATRIPAWRGEDAMDFAWGDLDDDALIDFYIVNWANQDWMLFQNGFKENKPEVVANRVGVGHWANNTNIGLPADMNATTRSDFGDIDGDGDMDAVLGTWSANISPRIWINDGASHFYDESPTRAPDTNCATTDIRLFDLDGDTDLDILMVCYQVSPKGDNGGLRQLVNDGLGHFTDVSVVNMPYAYAGNRFQAMEMTDFDHDGDQDMIVVGDFGGTAIMVNAADPFHTGGAYFYNLGTTPLKNNGGGTKTDVIWRDFNQDGWADLYMGNDGGQNSLYYNDGTGILNDVTTARLPAVSDGDRAIIAEDFDKDGDIDLYVATSGEDRLYISDTSYFFADVTQSNLQTLAPWDSNWADKGDIDKDGWMDVVITNTSGTKGQLALGIGEARFSDQTPSMPETNDINSSIRVFDIDGDGRLDLFYSTSQMDRIYLNKTPPK